MEDKEWVFHNDAISLFNNRLYANIFTEENIISKKKSLKIGDEKFYGYYLEKGKEMFFAIEDLIKQLPFKILEFHETDFKNEVFKVITKVESITIPAEKRMTFRDLVDIMPAFQHTKPIHFLLYKIVAIACFIDRLNARVSTDAGFGKDSVANIIANLVDSTANLYGATFAKLEYVLYNKFIVLNELGNLKKEELTNMQEFLLATGAYFNIYTKRTRKTNTTQEQYDISKTSLLLFYNLPSYYLNKNQEYFDQMFTKAVTNRFIPFVFDGRLSTSFEKVIDIEGIVNRNEDIYKNVIATLNYYKNNNIKEIAYKVDRQVIKFPEELKRYDRSLNIILKYVAEYSSNQEEFDMLSKELYKCYKKYGELLKDVRKK
jgi:hypothetical protein